MKRVWVAAVRNDVTRKDCVCKQLKTVCIRAILNYIMNYAKALAWLFYDSDNNHITAPDIQILSVRRRVCK